MQTPPPGFRPPYSPPSPQPGKKKFKFEMWMLVVPIGVTIIVVGLLRRNTVDVGGECSNDECKAGLQCLSGTCTKSCSLGGNDCPSGFACQSVKVTLKNSAGFHDLGAQPYCVASGKR
jgi:hypothetical protein